MTSDEPIHRIARRVVLDTAPATVEGHLAYTVWWPAICVEPHGTGAAVSITADVSPARLGELIEGAALHTILQCRSLQPTTIHHQQPKEDTNE